ncbi:hypothetical protein [Acaryochloris sp. IP29b_bin.148]|uniref:hypothetical protein n=1 Tax=Acaryochloris sp. IP29b_bin.148 TaxID=2969218 RepID=UPI00262F8628|nr:hypothetical protein [Acaryochloris sp. IP29b_bin.148]
MLSNKSRGKINSLLNRNNQKIFILKTINTVAKIVNKSPKYSARTIKLLIPKPIFSVLKEIYAPVDNRQKVRRHLREDITLEDFFKALKERNINYVILRWFESMPVIETGEDIDLLVDDRDIPRIADLFSTTLKTIAFDVYSVSGIPGADYQGMSYYPAHLARKILVSRIWFQEIYAVPNPELHFLSLAYHAIYHKGEKSGLSHHQYKSFNGADHDYYWYLQKIAKVANFAEISNDFTEIHRFLKSQGWSPRLDTLRRLAVKDQWLLDLLPTLDRDIEDSDGELMVFITRDWIVKNNKEDIVLQELINAKIEVIDVFNLSETEIETATQELRGGQWDQGPYPVSGGKPSQFIICYDYHPEASLATDRKTHPFVRNRHVFIKNKIRNYFNNEMFWWLHMNCIHAADDELESWEYIKLVIPQHLETINKKIEKRRSLYQTSYPILHLYESNKTRSKVELILYKERKSIKKTFKYGLERFCEREILGYELIGKEIEVVPPLLEKNDNYIIIPWYENILENCSSLEKKQLLKPHAESIINMLKTCYDLGYALIGCYPGNLILTPSQKLIVVDFEFLYKYKKKPENFLLSYDVVGIPKDFDGDLPRGTKGKGHTYANTWQPLFGPISEYIQ